MPFKGDMRLGGPHDNEARLNGTSDGPSVPVAGTYLRTDSNVVRPIAEGGGYTSYSDATSSTYEIPNQTVTVQVKADGIGGEYYDWDTATNVEFIAGGTQIYVGTYSYSYPLNVNISGYDYQVGNGTSWYVHDGYGGVGQESSSSYYDAGTFLFTQGGATWIETYYETEYQIGTKDINYYTDGTGWYTTSEGNTYPYVDYTVVGTRSGGIVNTYVEPLNASYPSGTEIFEVYVYNGQLTDSGAATGTDWYPSGTRIAEGYDYFWNGEGGYYYSEPTPSDGTPTGNTTSGYNYINIDGMDYNNGTYSGTEYHDGTGGTRWEYSYSYMYYGYEFTSGYYSDENGGYFT